MSMQHDDPRGGGVVEFEDTCFTGYFHDFGVDGQCQPVIFVWIATTPAGRQSRFFKTRTLFGAESARVLKWSPRRQHLAKVYVPTRYRAMTLADLAAHCAGTSLPRLRRGYTWHGPFLYEDGRVRRFGFIGNHWFLKRAPKHSDGIPLGYVVAFPRAA